MVSVNTSNSMYFYTPEDFERITERARAVLQQFTDQESAE